MMESFTKVLLIHFAKKQFPPGSDLLLVLNSSEISGPIILDTYRAIADFIKTSKHELNLHVDDLVEIVEKNPNGKTS